MKELGQRINEYLDEKLNGFLSCREKLVPYIGTVCNIPFYSEPDNIAIGQYDSMIGFMAINEWECPERYLTEDEVDNITELILTAMELGDHKLKDLWDYMQSLSID